MGPNRPICKRCARPIRAGMGCSPFNLRHPDGTLKARQKVCKACKAILVEQASQHFAEPPPPPMPLTSSSALPTERLA